MLLQIAILKVLVSHPEGRATIAARNSDLSILTTSGSARTDRLRRLRNRDVGHSALLDDASGQDCSAHGQSRPSYRDKPPTHPVIAEPGR